MSSSRSPLLGLRTAAYAVDDLRAARDWYAEVVGKQPYFDEPYYVGFNVGGFELGLMPSDGVFKPGAGGVNVLWGVDDIVREMTRLSEMGASIRDSVQDVGGGVKVGTVLDPFGNVFGLIENPGFRIE